MKVKINKSTWETAGNKMGWFEKSVKIKFNEDGFVLLRSDGSKLCSVRRDTDSAGTVESILEALGYKVECFDGEED